MVWLTGGMLALALAMIVGLLGLIIIEGAASFWPGQLVEVRTHKGAVYLGEVTDRDTYQPPEDVAKSLPPEAAKKLEESGTAVRRQFRTANFDITGSHFTLISDFEIKEEAQPEWALVVERLEYGRFHGFPTAFLEDGQAVATEPAEILAKFKANHSAVQERGRRRWRLQKIELGAILAKQEEARKAAHQVERERGKLAPEAVAASKRYAEVKEWAKQASAPIEDEIKELDKENQRYKMRLTTADGKTKDVPVADIVRLYPANQLGFWGKLGIALSRWWEFLTDQPREANSAGGVWPAICGTVAMTLLMTIVVVPFGVLAALYLREYAKAGPIVSVVRVAINNLAGVPSIVFGMFGLVFFCYIIGGGIDNTFYGGNMTFRKGALVWAALTLALLTLPVVIVAAEEALAAVPNSMREGSYACGASKWQTIRRIVVPRAMPGILTGMILAMARGAGEVAPIMLVGAVKLAPELPVDGVFPYVHPQRSFMHLGFHIFDLGFQSQNSEAAKPMVFTTTLLLITIIAVLNIAAVLLRSRLRKRFLMSKF
jgi:phosphate transport system permease protein